MILYKLLLQKTPSLCTIKQGKELYKMNWQTSLENMLDYYPVGNYPRKCERFGLLSVAN